MKQTSKKLLILKMVRTICAVIIVTFIISIPYSILFGANIYFATKYVTVMNIYNEYINGNNTTCHIENIIKCGNVCSDVTYSHNGILYEQIVYSKYLVDTDVKCRGINKYYIEEPETTIAIPFFTLCGLSMFVILLTLMYFGLTDADHFIFLSDNV